MKGKSLKYQNFIETNDIPESGNAGNLTTPINKPNKPLEGLSRNISEQELMKSPAAIQLLLDNLSELKEEKRELLKVKDEKYKTDTDNSVLKERLNNNIGIDIIETVVFMAGSILLTSAISMPEQLSKFITFGLSVILIIAGIACKIIRGKFGRKK